MEQWQRERDRERETESSFGRECLSSLPRILWSLFGCKEQICEQGGQHEREEWVWRKKLAELCTLSIGSHLPPPLPYLFLLPCGHYYYFQQQSSSPATIAWASHHCLLPSYALPRPGKNSTKIMTKEWKPCPVSQISWSIQNLLTIF